MQFCTDVMQCYALMQYLILLIFLAQSGRELFTGFFNEGELPNCCCCCCCCSYAIVYSRTYLCTYVVERANVGPGEGHAEQSDKMAD